MSCFSGQLPASPPPPSDYTFFATRTARVMFPEFLRVCECSGVAESVAESVHERTAVVYRETDVKQCLQ
jgi:hypothetical protein